MKELRWRHTRQCVQPSTASVSSARHACCRSNNPRPGDNLLQLEEAVEAAAAQLAAVNPTPDAAASPLLLGAWALLFSGRSRQLKAALSPAAAAAAGSQQSLRQAVQASSDALYSTFYKFLPVLAGSAVGAGRRSTASNLQVLLPGRVDNVVSTRGRLPLRICVSGTVEEVSAGNEHEGDMTRLGVLTHTG